MAQAWMPGARRIDGGIARTVIGAGAPRVVWTVTGSDPNAWSAREEALRLLHQGRAPHLVWNPVNGEVAQLLAATRRAEIPLGTTSTYRQYLDHGDEGRVCVVVCVVATEREPFTDGPLRELSALLEWLDSWGVPRVWPAGPPGHRGAGWEETTRIWSRGGHFGHDQVPGSVAAAPGHIRPERVLTGFFGAREEQEVKGVVEAPNPPHEHPKRQPSVIK